MVHFKQIEASTIFTIGHSSLDMESFIRLLKGNYIDIVVDVRSNPYSRYAPQFSKNNIQDAMETKSIKYLFFGKELGGKPSGREYYDSRGYVLYSKIADSLSFKEGIKRLVKGVKAYRIALMCSEENPANCHRMLLIGRVLADNGVKTLHIRSDARIQSDDDVIDESNKLKKRNSQQQPFREIDKPNWKEASPERRRIPEN